MNKSYYIRTRCQTEQLGDRLWSRLVLNRNREDGYLRRHPLQQDKAQRPMDRGFIALLFLTAASGLALMLVKHTPALPLALSAHLGAVMARAEPTGRRTGAVWSPLVRTPRDGGQFA